jgi:hypothetical protein
MALWMVWAALLPRSPIALRVVIAFAMFVLGPGWALSQILARGMTALERTMLTIGAGLMVSPLIAHLVSLAGWVPAFPHVATALGGLALGLELVRSAGDAPKVTRRDLVAAALVAALALATGFVAYAHRMSVTDSGLTIMNGDYDTFDSTYYAAISAELANQVPPDAPFRAGHRLGYAYYPQLLLAMIHRFGGVPLLDLYLRYAWPVFLTMTLFVVFVCLRRIMSTGAAALSACFMLLGSDLSFLPALFRARAGSWDQLIWSTNWLTPGGEQLFFNTWTPALAVLFVGIWMLDRHDADPKRIWSIGAAACFASLVEFKPFGFAAVMGGLIGAAIVARDTIIRKRLALVCAMSVALAIPYLISIRSVYQESQAILHPGNAFISVVPQRVVYQLGLEESLARITGAVGGGAVMTAVVTFVVANLLFLVGGLGVRVFGLPAIWRALGDQRGRLMWRVLAWTIVAGAAFPLVVITEPYHQTFHTYQTSLYLLWIFVAFEAFRWGTTRRRRVLVAALLMIAAVPSTVHYLHVKWRDSGFAAINRDSYDIATRLRQEDFAHTVFLERYPQGPSFIGLLAERRTVLAWAGYSRDALGDIDEINQFFTSADGDPAVALKILERFHVTHVVETVGRDHIHPRVMCHLTALLYTPTLRLYAVGSDGDAKCVAANALARAQ